MICSRLTYNKDSKPGEADYVELGLTCADVCGALHRGIDGKRPGDLSWSVHEAVAELTTWVKPAMNSLDSPLMILLIVELLRKSRRRSLRRVDGIYSPGLSM